MLVDRTCTTAESKNVSSGIGSFVTVTQNLEGSGRRGTSNGVADALGDQLDDRLAVSPDGKLLAYRYTQFGRVPSEGWTLAVVSTAGSPPVKTFKISGEIRDLRWSPDGKNLQYLLMKD